MTTVAFHFGAPDKLAYTCRLLRKATKSGSKVLVVGDADVMAQLDKALWAVSDTDFVTHCSTAAHASIRWRSAAVLATSPSDLDVKIDGERDLLVNLSDAVPPGFDNFARVIEVVSTAEEDRSIARTRWRAYAQQGYPPQKFDLTTKS